MLKNFPRMLSQINKDLPIMLFMLSIMLIVIILYIAIKIVFDECSI